MENKSTLREICTKYQVSRRAIQGYEKMGLVFPTSRTERGYLLYDLDMQQRIGRVKLFQEMGFTLIEIKTIIDAPVSELQIALKERIEGIKEEIEYKQKLIEIARKILENL